MEFPEERQSHDPRQDSTPKHIMESAVSEQQHD